MRRRKFLQIAGLGAAAVAVPSISVYSASLEEATAGIILNQFGYLKINREGLAQFVTDYYKANGSTSLTMQLKTKFYYFFNVDPDRSKLVKDLATSYLLSTDFFQNRMDESKEVKYLGWRDPHKAPCANPFSFLYYPPASV